MPILRTVTCSFPSKRSLVAYTALQGVVLALFVWGDTPPCRHSACPVCKAQRHSCEPKGSMCLMWESTAGILLNAGSNTDTPAHMYKCLLQCRPLYVEQKWVGQECSCCSLGAFWFPTIWQAEPTNCNKALCKTDMKNHTARDGDASRSCGSKCLITN